MPPPAAIAGIPLFSTASPPPVFIPGGMVSQFPPPPLPGPVLSVAPPPTARPVVSPGGTLVPPKLAQRIQKGEFIDMAELSPEKLGQPEETSSRAGEGESRKRKRKRVASILHWVECFNTYIGVIAQLQPARTADLLAYASLVVHAARKFKGDNWMQYDRNFRKRAETHPGIRWAEANPTIWTLAFSRGLIASSVSAWTMTPRAVTSMSHRKKRSRGSRPTSTQEHVNVGHLGKHQSA